jgi:hypothetical protein
MRIPTTLLEGKKIPRIIFSIRPAFSSGHQGIASLMRIAYEMGVLCFDLPTVRHVQSFKELSVLKEDEDFIDLPYIEAKEGASLSAIPLHRVEAKVSGTIIN